MWYADIIQLLTTHINTSRYKLIPIYVSIYIETTLLKQASIAASIQFDDIIQEA